MKKAIIELDSDELVFDGVRILWEAIPQILYEIAHPDPRKWYRFERVNDVLIVHVLFHDPREDGITTEVSNGHYVRDRGRSREDAGFEGQETPHPRDENRPNR